MFRHLLPLVLMYLVLAACSGGGATRADATPTGFTPLFNGTDLSGWWGLSTEDPAKWKALAPEQLAAKKAASLADIAKHWKAENGELVNDGNGLYLTSEAEYGDFELRLDYKTVAKADSGVYLRGVPQVQIWDTTEAGGKWNIGADKGSGGLWNSPKEWPGRDPLVKADKPFGEWNHLCVVMVGERVSVWFNAQRVVDHARMQNYFAKDKAVPRSGPIQLQTHGGEIRWRNVLIRSLPSDEALSILRAGGVDKPTGDDDFTTLFNGKDFTGWKGPVENYDVVDGAI
ncbi:MAG TPA: family 16 glycoside hydrolase, partial [Planctomycetota bacterium]|nr:family 16 glycoside hydrolase [Planctomycetota bacterium]